MGVKSKGRGLAATFGLLLVLAGVAGAAAFWWMAERRPEQAVEGFARGPVGCTTTLEFTDTGRFYIYEELAGSDASTTTDCEPVAIAGEAFSFQLFDGGRAIVTRDDASITYDTEVGIGTSAAWVEIDTPGRYDLVVRGSDPAVVAAVGRDPDEGVDDLRRGAVAVGVVGVVLGVLMLLLAGRRSKKAATYATPTGPGWGPGQVRATDVRADWPPVAPRIPQVPINPMQPSEPAVPTAPSAGDSSGEVAAQPASPWAPPSAGERKDPPPPSE